MNARVTTFAICLLSAAAATDFPNTLEDCEAVALKFDSTCNPITSSAIDLAAHQGVEMKCYGGKTKCPEKTIYG